MTVVGHSLTAWVALEYARAFPERVTGVVMIGMSPALPSAAYVAEFMETDASPARKAAHERQQRQWEAWLGERESPDDLLIRFYRMNSAIYWYDPEFDSGALWDGAIWDLGLFQEVVATSAQDYDAAAGPPVDVPVFVALGRYDYRVPYTLWDHRAKAALVRLSFHVSIEAATRLRSRSPTPSTLRSSVGFRTK